MKKVILILAIMMLLCVGCSSNNHLENRGNKEASVFQQKYIDFIKDNLDYDEKDTVTFFAKEDIDLDGNNEVVIALGHSDEESSLSYISQVYILRDNNEKIEQIGENLNGYGYSVNEVKLIQLQNKNKKYIYCGLTNSANLTGFKIIELVDNQPQEVCYSASATGAGNDVLKDFDNDGQFDGYVQNRWSYDVLYYSIDRIFTLKNDDFIISKTKVDLPEYPDNVKEVVVQYLTLRVLNIEKSLEVDLRLAELCEYNKANYFDFSSESWYTALYNTICEFDEKINFDINENSDFAEVEVFYVGEYKKEYKYKFYLTKSDSKWHIVSIEWIGNDKETFNIAELYDGGILSYVCDKSLFDSSIVIKKDQDVEIVYTGEDDYVPSLPKLSPNGKLIAYIDNVGFEERGNAFIYDYVEKTNNQVTMISRSDKDTVKKVEWYNNDLMFVIIGFASGTVSQGGDLYLLDINTKELKMLRETNVVTEFVNMEYRDGKLKLKVVEWDDESCNTYKYRYETIDTRELLGDK